MKAVNLAVASKHSSLEEVSLPEKERTDDGDDMETQNDQERPARPLPEYRRQYRHSCEERQL